MEYSNSKGFGIMGTEILIHFPGNVSIWYSLCYVEGMPPTL